MLRLTTIGRRSGQSRVAIIGYYEDGPNLVTLAMNGWGEKEPAWWLNLQAQPDTTVDLAGDTRAIRARAATGDERDRLWAKFPTTPAGVMTSTAWPHSEHVHSCRRPGATDYYPHPKLHLIGAIRRLDGHRMVIPAIHVMKP